MDKGAPGEMTGVQGSEEGLQAYLARRTTSGIAGFDTVMQGGLLNGATHLVAGASGTGKTVLTQQIAFHQAAQGNNVLCLTLLSESHEKMIVNLSAFSFFDENLIGAQIHYLSLYSEVEREGLEAFNIASRRAVIKHKARLVIVDGVSSLRDFAETRREFRKVLFDFNTQLSALGCTVLLLVDDELSPEKAPEYAIADTIIRLHNQTFNKRHVRSLEVIKSRATPALPGHHHFDITGSGLVIYPDIETLLAGQKNLAPPAPADPRRATGVSGLDQMLSGGLLSNSVNLILGTPGSGKTLLGWRFLYEGARQGEKTLLLSFQHSEESVRAISKSLGFDLSPCLDNDGLRVLWLLPLQRHLDEVTGYLLRAIEEYRPNRLVIDSLSEMEALSIYPDQLSGFWTALTNYLRNAGITTVVTVDYKQVVGDSVVVPERPISMMADALLFLRGVEAGGKLYRLISVLELRNSPYDSAVREISIGRKGLSVGQPFSEFEQVLSGLAHRRDGD